MPIAVASRDLTSIVLALLVLGIMLATSYWVMAPFLPALTWATMIVISSWPIMRKAQAKLWNSRTLAVLLMTSILLLILILPLTIAIIAIVENVGTVSDYAQQLSTHGLPPPPEWVGKIPLIGARIAHKWDEAASLGREEAAAHIAPYLGQAISWLLRRIGSIGGVFVHFLLTVILAGVLYAKGETAARGVRQFAQRLGGDRAERALVLAAQAIRAIADGVVLTALMQAILAFVGLLLAGVPYSVVIASLVFFLGVIQIGAGPVLIGVVIWLFHSEHTTAAWVFLVWSIIIMVADNFVRPILIKRGADFPLLLIFAGVIGGLISFGIIGIFIGPVILAVSYTWVQAWANETAGRGSEAQV
jgi:predicted PurR-regulated permease PerM